MEDGGTSLFMDFGTNFKAKACSLMNFLGQGTFLVFNALLNLDILPPLRGLYRQDLECPGVWDRFLSHPDCREAEVAGVLLSHAHFRPLRAFFVSAGRCARNNRAYKCFNCKALQDTGGGNRLQEICYASPKELKDGILCASHYRKMPSDSADIA
ncbi:MAG: hypothetical protein ACOX15_07650 [Tepidanaerobacteraceae bacterium]